MVSRSRGHFFLFHAKDETHEVRQNRADVRETCSLQENTGIVSWPHDDDLEKKKLNWITDQQVMDFYSHLSRPAELNLNAF